MPRRGPAGGIAIPSRQSRLAARRHSMMVPRGHFAARSAPARAHFLYTGPDDAHAWRRRGSIFWEAVMFSHSDHIREFESVGRGLPVSSNDVDVRSWLRCLKHHRLDPAQTLATCRIGFVDEALPRSSGARNHGQQTFQREQVGPSATRNAARRSADPTETGPALVPGMAQPIAPENGWIATAKMSRAVSRRHSRVM